MSSFQSQSQQEISQVASQVPTMDASELAMKNTMLEKKLDDLNNAVVALKELESTIQTLKDDVQFHMTPAWLREAGKDANGQLITMSDIEEITKKAERKAERKARAFPRPVLKRQTNDIDTAEMERPDPTFQGSCLNVPINQIMSNNVSREISYTNTEDACTGCDCECEMPDDHYEDNVVPLHKEDVPKKYSMMVDSLVGPDSPA